METKEFLSEVLSDSGWYCLFGNDTEKDRRTQKFYATINELVDESYILDQQGYDVYFALATFREKGSRKVENVQNLKSLFLDLDCGPSKDFTTQKEAIDKLRKFVRDLKLPKPLMVSSGRGVHVYWILEEAVPLEEWLPVAEQLKVRCAKHKFLADPAVTADAARVLRPLGTHNHKTSPPTEVFKYGVELPPPVNFDVLSELLGKNLMPVVTKIENRTPNATLQALMGNVENKFGTIVKKINAGTGCKQLELIATDKETTTEPMWRAGLSIAKFCSDGEKAAQYISKGHEGYSEEATAAKVQQIKGPYLCVKFDEFNPDVCPQCQHWNKIKSPIILGKNVIAAEGEDNIVEAPSATLPNAPVQTYTIPDYPSPYFRGANGGIYIRARNVDGEAEERLIYHNDFYVVKRVVDVEIGEAIVMRLHLPKDGVREFTVPLTAVTSREEFRKNMSMQGVAVNKMDELMQYTTTWVNELQAMATADVAHRQFGWTSDAMESFVLGNQEIFADRIEFNPPASNTVAMFPAFDAKGSLSGWKDMAAFLNEKGQEPYQYIMGASFGSALMQLMPVACSVLHVHSDDSGFGKTTAQFAGLGVWGNPEELILEKEDTYNTKMNRAEVYHSVPLFLDELTNMAPKELSDLAYQYYAGRQKRRLTSGANVERYNGPAWSFMAVSTGNASLIEKIMLYKKAPKAESQRILEYKISKHFKDAQTKTLTDEFQSNVLKHYGHAGVPFVQYVINNLEEVTSLLKRVQVKIDTEAGLAAENRFWSAGAACTLSALIICRNLGLLPYKSKPVYKWILEVLRTNKKGIEDMTHSAEQTLNDYMNDHYGNVLWIRSTDDLRKQNGNGLDTLVIPDVNPRARLVARYETDLKRAYLVPKPLREWCGKQQINYAAFIESLTEKMGAKKSKMRLSKGTHMNLPPTDVIIVNCLVEQTQEDNDE